MMNGGCGKLESRACLGSHFSLQKEHRRESCERENPSPVFFFYFFFLAILLTQLNRKSNLAELARVIKDARPPKFLCQEK